MSSDQREPDGAAFERPPGGRGRQGSPFQDRAGRGDRPLVRPFPLAVIIKSMPRKDPSFRQLLAYMGRGGESGPSVFHNAYWSAATPAGEIAAEFERNAAFLPARSNGNCLYHEILALSGAHGLGNGELAGVLSDLAYEYLALRAPGQMAC